MSDEREGFKLAVSPSPTLALKSQGKFRRRNLESRSLTKGRIGRAWLDRGGTGPVGNHQSLWHQFRWPSTLRSRNALRSILSNVVRGNCSMKQMDSGIL